MAITINGNGTVTGISAGGLPSAATDLSNDTSPQLGGSLDMNNLNITCNDSSSGGNNRIVMGNGADFQLWHDGSHSYIADEGTGNLILLTSKLNVNNAAGTEGLIHAEENGKVELYHDNNIRFETTQYGAKITSGTNDNGKLEFKSGNHDHSCIGYTGLNRFAIDGHDGLEVRDPSDSYATRMKIGSDGKFEVFGNRPSANAQLFQNISSTNPEGLYIQFTQAAPNTASRHFLFCGDNSDTRAVIDSNGNLRNYNASYGGFSDVSLKENIVDASSQWDDIKNTKVRVFNFKTDDASEKRIGVIAQEIETVCPKLVDEVFDKDDDGNLLKTSKKSVKYSVLYMKAIKALQEAMEKIETLEAKVAALEAA